MEQKNNKFNSKQQRTLLNMFLKAAGTTLAVCILLVGGIAATYYFFLYEPTKPNTIEVTPAVSGDSGKVAEELPNVNKNIAVFGVDADETRTDVIMVVNFNTETGKVKVVSVPRDTKVVWSEQQKDALYNLKGYTMNYTKINEMSAYGGIKNIRDFTIDEIENILGQKIDNYIIVNINAFRKIVDAVGGVEVDVPMDMYYTDSSQDLYINLKKGVQTLDGEDAEGLVRFRYGYKEGDVGRIETQKLFIKALADKVLSPKIIKSIPSIVTTLFTNVTTDIKLGQISEYYSYIEKFNPEDIEFYTVPGVGAYEGIVSYYFIDEDELDEMIDEVFYDKTAAGEESEESSIQTTTEPVVDYDVTIEIYNATGKKGLAGALKDTLEKAGYTVALIDNHTESDLDKSVIYAKDATKGEQFKEYISDVATVESSTTINYDIQIVLGEDFIK